MVEYQPIQVDLQQSVPVWPAVRARRYLESDTFGVVVGGNALRQRNCLVEVRENTVQPKLYTPHPTPHTSQPTPYTLHLTPCKMHPTLRRYLERDAFGVVVGGNALRQRNRLIEVRQRLRCASRFRLPLWINPCVKPLRSSYTGVDDDRSDFTRGCIPRVLDKFLYLQRYLTHEKKTECSAPAKSPR